MVKYVVLVSHGEFAQGMHSVVKMIAGERKEVLSTSLKHDMGSEQYADNFRKLTADITPEDQIILFADIIGGSPLTTALNVLDERGMTEKTIVFGGMNLSMVLVAVINKDISSDDVLKKEIISEGQNAVREFCLLQEADDEI